MIINIIIISMYLNFLGFWERCYNKCCLNFNIDFFFFKLVISDRDITLRPRGLS